MRKVAVCLNCGEPREIAAHGLCFKCYGQRERSDEREFVPVDRHSPAVRREHKKLFRGFTSVMVGLADLSVQEPGVLAIRRMLEPYVAPITQFLSSPAELRESLLPVNGEQQPGKVFTIQTPSVGRRRKRDTKSENIERKQTS